MENSRDADGDSFTSIIHFYGSPINQIYTVHTHTVKHIMQRLPAYSTGMTAYTVVIRMVT